MLSEMKGKLIGSSVRLCKTCSDGHSGYIQYSCKVLDGCDNVPYEHLRREWVFRKSSFVIAVQELEIKSIRPFLSGFFQIIFLCRGSWIRYIAAYSIQSRFYLELMGESASCYSLVFALLLTLVLIYKRKDTERTIESSNETQQWGEPDSWVYEIYLEIHRGGRERNMLIVLSWKARDA